MFRCKDCGQEFEIKPDYCDCGNDVFEEILPEPEPVLSQPKPQTNAQGGMVLNVQKPQQTSDVWHTQKPVKETHNIRFKVDLASLMIFLLCIILAILSVIYIGKDSLEKIEQEKNQPKENKTNLVPTKNIPSIDKLWKEGTVRPVVKQQIQPKVEVTPVAEVQPVKKTQVQPVQVKSSQPVVQKPKSTTTTTTKPKQVVQTVKPKTTATTTSAKPKQQTQQTTQTTTPKTTQTSQTTKTITTQVAKPVTTQVQQPVQTQNTAQMRQELASYKVGLRNKLAKGINFTHIIGDGNCSVSFRVDTAGNLINRKFSVQSDNDSLNNEVYKTIMNNPTYKSPPEGYKNETMTFSVKMYGGRFTVTLN